MNKNLTYVLSLIVIVGTFFSVQVRSAQAQTHIRPDSMVAIKPGWIFVEDHPEISNRGMRAVYDSNRNVVVMFGGWLDQTEQPTNLTWEFKGITWQQIDTPTAPPARIWHGMAYDSDRQVVVLYGGRTDASGDFYDTWEYDGNNWSQVFTDTEVHAFYGFGMTYDSCRKRVLLYQSDIAITWAYDGIDWQIIDTAAHPTYNFLTALVFDPARCRAVLFGGGTDETWEFDGVDWEQIITAHKPMSRWAHSMAYNPLSGNVVLFGGYGPEYPSGTALADTWEYDGIDWNETSPLISPSAREQHVLVYEGNHRKILLFGGFGSGETWFYKDIYTVAFPLVLGY